MEIGSTIRELRLSRGLRQEQLATELGVSVQTISRWENEVNLPDLSMLPILASFFRVTTDYLLGVKGENSMAKLLKTVETFELPTREDAEKMIGEFRAAPFPKLISADIREEGGAAILEVTKEFGVDLDAMKFDR